MTDITGLKNFAYDQVARIGLPAVYLAVSPPLIGFYDNLNDNAS